MRRIKNYITWLDMKAWGNPFWGFVMFTHFVFFVSMVVLFLFLLVVFTNWWGVVVLLFSIIVFSIWTYLKEEKEE